MKPYPAYKDSGVEWLGQVPDGWGVVPVKRRFFVGLGKMLQPASKAEGDFEAPYLRAANIQWSGIDLTDVKTMWFSSSEAGTLDLQSGDLLVSEGGDVGRSALLKDDLEGVYFQNSVNRVRPCANDSTKFLYYWMAAIKESGYIDVLCNKSTIAHFTAEKVEAVPIPLPPLPEQQAIATFLDCETAKIDGLIEEQRRLIALLAEKRQATISHAVTRGLNPSARLKPSGVDWLGDIPERWEVVRLRHLCQILRGKFTHRPRNDPAFYDGDYPFIQTGDITGASRYIRDYKQTLNERGASVSKQFPAGTLVMAIAANLGDVAILTFDAFFPDSIVGLLPGEKMRIGYLYYLMIALKPALLNNATMSTQLNINADQISAILATRPPVDEQDAIAAYLDDTLSQFDALTETATSAISLLQERRAALISAAVTGKIDVRDLALVSEAA